MATVTLGNSEPSIAAIINTEPKQLRFQSIANQAFTIRISYVQIPTAITSGTQTLILQEEWHELLYLKFIEKIANSRGEDGIELKFNLLYDKQLAKDLAHVESKHLMVSKLRFSWL